MCGRAGLLSGPGLVGGRVDVCVGGQVHWAGGLLGGPGLVE